MIYKTDSVLFRYSLGDIRITTETVRHIWNSYSKGSIKIVTVCRQFDQRRPAYTIKVPRRDPENTNVEPAIPIHDASSTLRMLLSKKRQSTVSIYDRIIFDVVLIPLSNYIVHLDFVVLRQKRYGIFGTVTARVA